MTRLQRLGLLVILIVIIVLQTAYVEVLAHLGPAHLPLATWYLILFAVVCGGLAWMIEWKGEK